MNVIKNSLFRYPERSQKIILIVFIILGFSIRLFHFLYNRSLWMDEVYLSTSFVKMNLVDLITKPLYYQQKAPIGFLILVKFCINTFGRNEMALRLVPFISGTISILLFIPLAKFYLKGWPSLLAIGILCLSPALIYHSVEIKQYSTELLGTVLCLQLMIIFRDSNKIPSLLTWGFLGGLVLWFSYSSIFILGGIGIGLAIKFIIQHKWNLFLLSLIPSSIWILSFGVNYLLFTHHHAESSWIVYWFKAYHNFMPFPPKSVEDFKWFAITIYRMTDYPLGLLWNFFALPNHPVLNIIVKMPFIPIGFLLFGWFIFLKKNKYEMMIISIGILLMLIASGLNLYPLTERFWVFISPVFLIILAKGFEAFADSVKSKLVVVVVFSLIMFAPLFQSFSFTINPNLFYTHKKSYQREALLYVNANFREGDAVYIYWNDLPGYRLYKSMYKLKYKSVEGNDVRLKSQNFNHYYKNLKSDFAKMSHKNRIWIIYNTQFLTDIGDKIDEPNWYYNTNPANRLKEELLKTYKLSDQYVTKDITVYLLQPINR